MFPPAVIPCRLVVTMQLILHTRLTEDSAPFYQVVRTWFLEQGPPSKLSMKVGISTVGIASFGISDPAPAWPASFFLDGADDQRFYPRRGL